MLDIEDLEKHCNNSKLLQQFTKDLYHLLIKNNLKYQKAFSKCRQKYKTCPSKIEINKCYKLLVEKNELEYDMKFDFSTIKKLCRSDSGIVVVTIFTAPGKMISSSGDVSCPKNCHYCPQFPNQPRSYDPAEPAAQRAERNNFDPILQIFSRLSGLKLMGHNIEKVQLEISGGTWCYYPREYIDEFVKQCYYATNIFTSNNDSYKYIQNGGTFRECNDLLTEQTINETSDIKIIGITIETRPDSINKREIKRLRKYGITRVQLGIQHTDNKILELVNRQDTIENAKEAIKLLKINGFKIDIHIMPDLPGSSPEIDLKMMQEFLDDPDLQADFWKIYPCQVIKYTEIKKWYDNGTYKPYGETHPEVLADIISQIKKQIPPWIRLNRIVRDFPGHSIHGGLKITNLRQIIKDNMKKNGLTCNCIRCREVRSGNVNESECKFIIRDYIGSNGKEYFISYESPTALCGFLRLRFNNIDQKPFFNALENTAFIRELHVLGVMTPTGKKHKLKYQHFGIGKKLIQLAEKEAIKNKYKKIAIIAGVGTRKYYEKYGYLLQDTYMVKELKDVNYYDIYINYDNIYIYLLGVFISLIVYLYY